MNTPRSIDREPAYWRVLDSFIFSGITLNQNGTNIGNYFQRVSDDIFIRYCHQRINTLSECFPGIDEKIKEKNVVEIKNVILRKKNLELLGVRQKVGFILNSRSQQ